MDFVLAVMNWVGEPLFWGGIGMLIGWNVMPQPKWVASAYGKAMSWVKSKVSS